MIAQGWFTFFFSVLKLPEKYKIHTFYQISPLFAKICNSSSRNLFSSSLIRNYSLIVSTLCIKKIFQFNTLPRNDTYESYLKSRAQFALARVKGTLNNWSKCRRDAMVSNNNTKFLSKERLQEFWKIERKICRVSFQKSEKIIDFFLSLGSGWN